MYSAQWLQLSGEKLARSQEVRRAGGGESINTSESRGPNTRAVGGGGGGGRSPSGLPSRLAGQIRKARQKHICD